MSEAVSIASLALEVHRQPARHAELLRGFAPLPPGVAVLLRLAGGTALQEFDPKLVTLSPESELRKAALFFVEHVLFQRDASHYRVLGLGPAATTEQIKEHHRLLMRLFHPDRDTQMGESREHFATRANLAYNTLRDPGSRTGYDSTLKAKAAPSRPSSAPAASTIHTARHTPPRTWRRRPEPESFWTVQVYPLLMRYLPQWVLAGAALVSVSLVGMVYLFNQPLELAQTSTGSGAATDLEKTAFAKESAESKAQLAAADAPSLDAVVDQFERKIGAVGEMPAAPGAVMPEAANSAQKQVPAKAVIVDAPRPKPAQPVSPMAAQAAPIKPAPAIIAPKPQILAVSAPVAVAQPAVQETARPTSLPAVTVEAAPQPVAAAVRVTVQAVEPASQQPPQPDPNTLMSYFLEAYERGDVQTCMSLLDEGLRSNAGGKTELKREYDALFRSTDLRHLKILSMNWSRDGEFIRGEGRYRATLMRKGETLLRTQDGQLRVEVIRRGGTALISELYLAGRS